MIRAITELLAVFSVATPGLGSLTLPSSLWDCSAQAPAPRTLSGGSVDLCGELGVPSVNTISSFLIIVFLYEDLLRLFRQGAMCRRF